MGREDWENVARCARERWLSCMRHEDWEAVARSEREPWLGLRYPSRNWGDWESWQAAQALSGRSPF